MIKKGIITIALAVFLIGFISAVGVNTGSWSNPTLKLGTWEETFNGTEGNAGARINANGNDGQWNLTNLISGTVEVLGPLIYKTPYTSGTFKIQSGPWGDPINVNVNAKVIADRNTGGKSILYFSTPYGGYTLVVLGKVTETSRDLTKHGGNVELTRMYIFDSDTLFVDELFEEGIYSEFLEDNLEFNYTIQGAIDASSSGDKIYVAAGTYDERIDITKPLSLIGAGVGNSIIDATSFGTDGDVIQITALIGNTKIEGFDIKTGDHNNGITSSGGTGATGKIEILKNHIISTNYCVDEYCENEQFGIIAGYGDVRKLIISNNEISNTASNSILVELQKGLTEITNNTLNGGFPSIFFMTYDDQDVTTLQKISGNIIDMSTADIGTGVAGIGINPSTYYVTLERREGKYSNFEISNNLITGLHDISFKGISIGENSADGSSGGFDDLKIFGNNISGTDGKGIQLFGHITDSDIHDNILSGLYQGMKVFTYESTFYPENNEIYHNTFSGNTVGIVNLGTNILDATYNYWGDCTGPAFGFYNSGTGDSITNTSGKVLFNPWIGICIENKSGGDCAYELKNVTLSADVTSLLDINKVWFSYTLNGVNWTSKPATKKIGDSSNYSITIPSSELIGGMNVSWNVYANDSFGFEFHNGEKTFYVRNPTFLGINPSPDGSNGWWIKEPTFTLTKDSLGGNVYYQWDSDKPLSYEGSFGLENIPNSLNQSAGTIDLNWWTNFGGTCGNETHQIQMIYIDMAKPLITDLLPGNGTTVFTNRPNISVIFDDIYGTNSGLDNNSIQMKIDNNLTLIINTKVNFSGGMKWLLSFTPNVNLTEGNHQVYLNVTDKAGWSSQKTWNFTINTTASFDMIIYSPQNNTMSGEKQIPFNISLNNKVEKIEYKNYNDNVPKWRSLCKNCEEYGYLGREKTKSVNEDENIIGIRATGYFGQISEKNISVFVDSKEPTISLIGPKKNQVTNGSDFSLKYTENNLRQILLLGNKTGNITNQCNESGKNVICNAQIDLHDFDGKFIEYWFNVSDDIRSIQSKKTTVLVDTTSPILKVNFPVNNLTNTTIYERKVPFNISVSEEVTLEFMDNSVAKPKWTKICSDCTSYGIDKLKTKSFNEGTHNLTFRAIDEAGNSDSEAVNFNVVF